MKVATAEVMRRLDRKAIEEFGIPHMNMRWYLAMIEKIDAIHKAAKAGNGKIRYKGKIVGTFRPMPYDMGGAYELVTDLPKTEKAQLDKDILPEQ